MNFHKDAKLHWLYVVDFEAVPISNVSSHWPSGIHKYHIFAATDMYLKKMYDSTYIKFKIGETKLHC